MSTDNTAPERAESDAEMRLASIQAGLCRAAGPGYSTLHRDCSWLLNEVKERNCLISARDSTIAVQAGEIERLTLERASLVKAINNFLYGMYDTGSLVEPGHRHSGVPCAKCSDVHFSVALARLRSPSAPANVGNLTGVKRPMSKDQYIRHDFDGCLGHFIEECGEALAAAGETLKWGLASVNPELPPTQQETNAIWLQREMQGLREATERLQRCFDEGRLP